VAEQDWASICMPSDLSISDLQEVRCLVNKALLCIQHHHIHLCTGLTSGKLHLPLFDPEKNKTVSFSLGKTRNLVLRLQETKL
jgi:hypothetical protein